MLSMIKLIIFDAGGVLYIGSEEIVDEAVKKFLKKHGVYDLKKSDKIWYNIEKLTFIGKISVREAHERWLKGVGLSTDLVSEWTKVDRDEIWRKFRRTPGINRLLKKLKKEYILVVLSDTIDSKLEKIKKLEMLGINHKIFDEIITSHDLGACKPSRKVFEAVLKKFNVKPKEALFVGDSCDELKGATKLGLVTVGFKCCCGDHNIKRIDEITKILKKLN